MTNRYRKTWASTPPALPEEQGYKHPAHHDDPDMNSWNIGGPSEFAEDVRMPPYTQGQRPAIPEEDGYRHPADNSRLAREQAKKRALLASQTKAKSEKCVRLASYLLGRNASEYDLERQALFLMDTPTKQIDNHLNRFAKSFMTAEEDEMGADAAWDETMAWDQMAEDPELDQFAQEMEMASARRMANRRKLARRMRSEEQEIDAEDMEMLSEILDEEASKHLASIHYSGDEDDVEADEEEDSSELTAADRSYIANLLRLAEEEEEEEDAEEEDAEDSTKTAFNLFAGEEEEEEEDSEVSAGEEEEVETEEDEEDEVASKKADMSFFNSTRLSSREKKMLKTLYASDDDVEAEEEAEEEEVAAAAKKQAKALSPKTRQPSKGVKTLNAVRTANTSKNAFDLEQLWDAPPDINKLLK